MQPDGAGAPLALAKHVALEDARAMLGREPYELPGGHTPQWSRPRALCELLIALA